MKVAVVWNNGEGQVINRFGQPCPEKYGRSAVASVVDGLREGGHDVETLEGDVKLLDTLERFMPSDPLGGGPIGIVFNMAYGIQGECRYTHIPAILEMAGVPYTGSSPLGHALSLDKVITKVLIREAGVPTPNWLVVGTSDVDASHLRFPLIVKPRHESTSFGLSVVKNVDELRDAVLAVFIRYSQEALVEEFIEGREVCVGLLGNGTPECFPPVELEFNGRDMQAVTWEDKMHKRLDEPHRTCPAPLSSELEQRVRDIAVATFRACHCRDYARVDIRIDSSGQPYVLEINSMASLGAGASYVLAATKAGYTFPELVCRIVEVARERYFPGPAPRTAQDVSGIGSLESTSSVLTGSYLLAEEQELAR